MNTLVVDPDIPDTLYVGTDSGVMVSTNAGATWATLGNGLPRVVVTSLVLHRKTRTLRAATHGRSMWDQSRLWHQVASLQAIPLSRSA